MGNKIEYGLCNVHYALFTTGEDGAITYSVPKAIPGAVNISLEPVGEVTPFYADNVEYFTAIANNGYDGELEMALIPDEFKVEVLGEEVDAKGVQFEDANSQPKQIAILFQFEGDIKAKRHVLYNCKAARPTVESGTKGESLEPKTSTLTFSARPIVEGDKSIVKASTTAETDSTAYENWYKSVYKYEKKVSEPGVA